MLETRFREYALSGAILVLFQLILFAIADAVWGTSVLLGIKHLTVNLFATDSKGFENFLTVALGGLLFTAVFVLGLFVDQLNSLHFSWEMGAFEKRCLRNSWIEGLINQHHVFLNVNARELLSPRSRVNPSVLKRWRDSRFKIWRLFPALVSRKQLLHEADGRKRARQFSAILDFLQSFVLSGKGSSENASHVLGLIERWRLCRTLGTIIALSGMEHAGFVFWYFFKTDPALMNPARPLLLATGSLILGLFFALIPVLRSFHRMLDALFPAAYMLVEPPTSSSTTGA